jgi:deoxyribodipyrimidine photo-lyase
MGGGNRADAATYFRVFNPMVQSKNFPDGSCSKAFVPELAQVPAPLVHSPWTAPPFELSATGITLGDTHPYPIVDHRFARERAMAAYAAARECRSDGPPGALFRAALGTLACPRATGGRSTW